VPDAFPETSRVAVLLVSHDGARWLPAVIEGIRAQTAPLTQGVAVDTGSKDESADLLEQAFGDVQRVSGAVGYPGAVEIGLERLRTTSPDCEWVWLLHDDANPEPGALAAMLAVADEHPEVDILGPKLREWPSLRRLLEIGVTISGTGRRETGLERGEYDQGQHDEVRTVLAVNTAGMLVRRRVLEELGGFDEQLKVFGNDIDFGWRAAAAGHTTMVVPSAVVFHAEAAHRGIRRTPLTGRHTHYQERRAALYTLLVNSRPWALPLQAIRLASARSSGWSGSCWSGPSVRRSTTSPHSCRSTPARARSSPPGGSAAAGRPRTPTSSAACSRRGGFPTGTASTS